MIAEKKYIIPYTLREAMDMAIANSSQFKYLAGGTDVMVNRFQGNDNSTCLIDLSKISELKGIRKEGDFLRIGALEILEELKYIEELREEFPMLIEAALSVGSPLVRMTATLGGNILCENRCLYYNQSEWWREAVGYCLKCDGDICIATGGKNACYSELVSDTSPALIAMDTEIEWMDESGTHRKKLEKIYTGDGVTPRNLPGEAIVTALYLPRGREFKYAFYKLRERESLDYTSLTTAMTLDKDGNVKLAMAGVDPKPVVVEGSAADNQEEFIRRAYKGARAIDNDMYSRKYRKEMIRVYLKKSFEAVTGIRNIDE